MNGYIGQQKPSSYTDYDNTYFEHPASDGNIYTWRYSQKYVYQVVGKIKFMAKLFNYGTYRLNTMIM